VPTARRAGPPGGIITGGRRPPPAPTPETTTPMPAPATSTDRLLMIFAHPDDETFGCAGTVAALAERGVPSTLICLTRGEAGDSSIPNLDDPGLLGAVREQELRDAMAAVGLLDVRLGDFRDSGMPGSPAADDPRALVRADEQALAARLVVPIRALRPATVITFGPDGIYGHGDHLVAHRTATAAAGLAGDPAFRPELGPAWRAQALYYQAAPRDELVAMMERRGKPNNGMPEEFHGKMGVPREEIDTWIDVGPWGERKLAAMNAHRTQFGEGGPIADVPEEDRRLRLRRETFVRVALPWQDPANLPADPVARLAAERPAAH
jgi:N-acetyl-1-D-myo-inositol-2-amino-2-deoxy-alpha-D-glucopyranoside deacetylase